MTCTHSRTVELCLCHDDTAMMDIAHLKVHHDGYLPYIGILGGDDTNLEICLDCGQVIGWKPITDEEILKDTSINELLEEKAQEEQRKAEHKRSAASEPSTITLADIKLNNRVAQFRRLLEQQFGPNWHKSAEAKQLAESTTASAVPLDAQAGARLLKEFSQWCT